jgi:Flp pilus assembly pilin Flp
VSDAGAARAEARDILSERRFQQHDLPDPFRDVLDRVAGWLDAVFDAIGDLLDGALPGGRPVVWAVLIAVAVIAAAALVQRSLGRRRALPSDRVAAGAIAREDPDGLERRAREAAARGDHELALRLGFRAGVVRLHRRGRIDAEDSLSTGEVARAVRSPRFDRAAARFDEVVYGRRPAAAEDVESARAAWDEALR